MKSIITVAILVATLFTPFPVVAQQQSQEVILSDELKLLVPIGSDYFNWKSKLVVDTSIIVGDNPDIKDNLEIAFAIYSITQQQSLVDWINSQGYHSITNIRELDKIGAISFTHLEEGRPINRILLKRGNQILSVSHTKLEEQALVEQLLRSIQFKGEYIYQDSYSSMFAYTNMRDLEASSISEQSYIPQSNESSSYLLPWRNDASHQINQGWGGSYSHNCPGSACNAYDFNTSEGEELRAAATGTVSYAKSGSKVCGGMNYANDANYVVLDHADGTSTLYLHIQDVDVSVGQKVSAGQRIGTSGKSGWTFCGPHVHFQRQQQSPYSYYTQSQRIYFREYPGEEFYEGNLYTSQNSGIVGSTECGATNVLISGKTFLNTLLNCVAGQTLSVNDSKFISSAIFLSAGTRVRLYPGTKVLLNGDSESIFRAEVI